MEVPFEDIGVNKGDIADTLPSKSLPKGTGQARVFFNGNNMADRSRKGECQGTLAGADFQDKVRCLKSGARYDLLDNLLINKKVLAEPSFRLKCRPAPPY